MELWLLDVVDWDDGACVIGREGAHQRAAANRQLFLIERVEALASILTDGDQIGLFQLLQMVAYGGLIHFAVEFVHDIIHTQPYAAQVLHDFLARFVGKRLCKGYWINVHDLNYIDVYRYVKSVD